MLSKSFYFWTLRNLFYNVETNFPIGKFNKKFLEGYFFGDGLPALMYNFWFDILHLLMKILNIMKRKQSQYFR